MLCGNCKKNQATKTYEQIKKGKKTVDYYCMDCYARLFIAADETSETASVCPYCGTTAEEVKKRNLVGCANCYKTLKGVLFPVVTKMQGGEAHKGKSPLGGESERIARRCYELKTIADKLFSEGDYDGARLYLQRLTALENGMTEEGFVWRSQALSKRS
ncbi:MAG: hypothetical protein IJ514_06075 [Clostridia bacterium]|nr:hypothetical protein [Clostridia bacterium]